MMIRRHRMKPVLNRGIRAIDLSELTVKELKTLAEEHDIDLGDAKIKAAIVAKIENAG